MKKPTPIHQWILSFLLVDLFFVLSLVFGCASDPISCFESLGFSSYFFFLPWSSLLGFINVSYAGSILLMALVGMLFHGLLAHVPYRLFKRKKVSWLISIATAVLMDLVLAGTSLFILTQLGYII